MHYKYEYEIGQDEGDEERLKRMMAVEIIERMPILELERLFSYTKIDPDHPEFGKYAHPEVTREWYNGKMLSLKEKNKIYYRAEIIVK